MTENGVNAFLGHPQTTGLPLPDLLIEVRGEKESRR